MRERYLHALAELEGQIRDMGALVKRAVHNAIWSLEHNQPAFAHEIIAKDREIDMRRYAIETAALHVIARQQPLAGDLRVVSAILDLASELERIGDYAEGIAEIFLRCARQPPLALPPPISTMARHAEAMLNDALESLHNRDPEAATRLEAADTAVDVLYIEVTAWAMQSMRESPQTLERAMYYLWIAHNLERIADRTVNIGERTSFIATGVVAGKPSGEGLAARG
ncbi:MAG: phosphate signaling complex protein PhoU [Herpetosiphonaceae bacterium]|nr:phosphate signaling complex protein PhoU [Herpetosiphonaceae bacterium]